MSAYRGGCKGHGDITPIHCVCNCHYEFDPASGASVECDSPETCGPIGMTPVKATASDHVTVKHAKPRKTITVPRSRRTQRRMARAS